MERTGFVPEEASENKQLVPNYASFYGEPIMPPSDEGKKLTPEEFQEQFPVRYDVWNTLSQSMLGHSDTGVSLNNTEHIQTIKTRLHVLNQLDRYITSHHLNENGRTLRERQMTVFEDIRDHLEQGETQGYIKLPTGSGKTVIFTEIAEATDLRTLIVVSRQLLVDQTVERFQQFAPGMEVGKIYQGKKELGRQVEVTTYESMLSSIASGEMNPEDYNLVVLDEAHKGLTTRRKEAIGKFTNAIKLGFTATPNYSEAKRVENVLGKEIHAMTVREAVEEGMLSSLSVYLVRTNTDISNVKITSSGDYDPDELEKAINNKERNMAAVQTYQVLMKDPENQGKLSIAYCAGIQHARDLVTEFQQIGVFAGIIYGGQNRKERDQILADYRSGKIQVLCNARILIEGFDEPQTGIVLNVAPTASLVDAEQRGGRGLRLDPNNPNKHAIIVDIVDQTSNRRFAPVTFAQVVNGAYVLPRHSSSSSNGKNYPITSPEINIEGIQVVTNPEEVMRIIKENLISPDDILNITPDDILLNRDTMHELFIGDVKIIRQAINKIIDDLVKDHPEYIANKKNEKGITFRVITSEGKKDFLQKMDEEGLVLRSSKPTEGIQENELLLSDKYLTSMFVGTFYRIKPVRIAVVEQMKLENPEWIINRKIGDRFVVTVTAEGREEFIRRMQEAGLQLKTQEKAEISNNDDNLVVSTKAIVTLFRGGHEKVSPIAKRVIASIKEDHPQFVKEGRREGRGAQPLGILTSEGKEEFIRRMQEAGINLK